MKKIDVIKALDSLRVNVGIVSGENTSGIVFRTIKGEPLTHVELDGNFGFIMVVLAKLIDSGFISFDGLTEYISDLEDDGTDKIFTAAEMFGEVKLDPDSLIDSFDGELLSGLVYDDITKDSSDLSVISPDKYRHGELAYDSKTHKLLVFDKNDSKFYDSMGNVEYDFTRAS
jgi:hypothetical protein